MLVVASDANVKVSNEWQSANALSCIAVQPLPIETDVKETHPLNASFPIVFTLSGITMVPAKLVHPAKA